MIEVTHLTKKYGKTTAVNDLSFTAQKGEILGFLGPNGAGKSTTMNMITGYLASTSGTVKISGIDLLENPLEAKKHIGYLPEIPPLYVDMTVYAYLKFVAGLKKIPSSQVKEHLSGIIERTRLKDVENRLIKNLSKGYKQRVGLAQALVGSPDVLILDEPAVGLDPKQIIEMRNLIKELSEKHTILLSSHILSEISVICDRIMIINKGTMVASDTPENLKILLSNKAHTTIRVRQYTPELIDALKVLPNVTNVTITESSEVNTFDLVIEYPKDIDLRESVFTLCVEHQTPLLMMKSTDLSLEDIFLQVTSQTSSSDLLEDSLNEESEEDLKKEGHLNEDIIY